MDASGKILGYFIEEAKEHLDTLQDGILNLPDVMTDEEKINELFRAAHSVKGGAAMLGYSSIQKTAHKLEDCFKILQDNPVKVDKNLESLFLKVYDTLEGLVQRLQDPFGLREEDGDKIVQAAEPNFSKLQDYLKRLLDSNQTATATTPQTTSANLPAPTIKLAPDFAVQTMNILKQMLEIFKQKETPATRQQLLDCCKKLVQLGAGIDSWKTLLLSVYKAIQNPNNLYRNLAPVIIKELKQSSDLLSAGKDTSIVPSEALKQLIITGTSTPAAAPVIEKPVAAPVAPAVVAPTTPKQITITAEPREVAKALLQTFNKQQLSQLVQFLQKAIQ